MGHACRRLRPGFAATTAGAWDAADPTRVDHGDQTMTTTYEEQLRRTHRPAHARRSASSHASFFLPLLRPGDRLLDIGCGPASITIGLGEAVGPDGAVVGIDLHPGPASVPLACADLHRLPFADETFDAVFICAVLQHLQDPAQALIEARRVCRAEAVIGVADADWGGVVMHPPDPWLDRGHQIVEQLRDGTSPRVGRRLRELLHEAGFADAVCATRATGGGGPPWSFEGEFEAARFESAAVIEVVVERGIATAAEMAEIAAAWRRWSAHPGSTMARHWFEATARVAAPAARSSSGRDGA